jgi:hypothetical protein
MNHGRQIEQRTGEVNGEGARSEELGARSGTELKTENGKPQTENRFLRESAPVWQSALLEILDS